MSPPVGVSRLMDLLADSREVIRNDVGICLTLVCMTVCKVKVTTVGSV